MKAAHADRNGEEQSGATSGRWPTRPIRLAAGIPISARYTMAAICPSSLWRNSFFLSGGACI
jgi:hypothetical protein